MNTPRFWLSFHVGSLRFWLIMWLGFRLVNTASALNKYALLCFNMAGRISGCSSFEEERNDRW